MSFSPGQRVFVDESKAKGYYIAAAASAPSDVAPIEKALRALRHGGRSSIHFSEESNRREQLLREFCKLEVSVTVYVMRGAKDRIARPSLLKALVDDLVAGGAGELILERDASVEVSDRKVVRDRLESRRARDTLRYGHRNRAEQPLLWVADAVAWCHQAGKPWRGKSAPIVDQVVELPAR